MKIKNLKARKILNSNGNWTVECLLETSHHQITASVPAGISLGEKEAEPVKVKKAIGQIENEIFNKLKNKEINQEGLDEILDDGEWGSNATLAVSAAFFKLKNTFSNYSDSAFRPKLMMLIFEGKEHGNKNLKIQEFMVIVDQVSQGVKAYHQIKNQLESKGIITTVGVEGGFSPSTLSDNQILGLISSLELPIALDVAANTNPLEVSELVDLVQRFQIISLEDPISEINIKGWKKIFQQAKKVNPDILIIGDDLTVTDPKKIERAVKEKLINGVIIKPNQQGTITAGVKAVEKAKELGLKTITSHRGQSTNDTWIVDFGLKYQTDFVKFGAPCRGERVAKYNRLI